MQSSSRNSCPSANALDSHKKETAKLRKTLQKQDIAPIITEAIIQLLEHSRKGYCDLNLRNVVATDEMRELTRNTMANQLSTGITYFLQGYITKHWVVIQNLYRKHADFNDDNTFWARSVIAGMWEYSVSMWTSRCEHVNGKTDASMRITKIKEIVKMINEHLKRTKSNPDHNVQQLRRNIARSLGNANVMSLQTWLRMIRTVKECKLQDKNQERIPELRAQPMSRFLVRR